MKNNEVAVIFRKGISVGIFFGMIITILADIISHNLLP